MVLSTQDQPEQRYWLNKGPVVGVTAVRDWAVQLLAEVNSPSTGLLFSLVELYTEGVLHSAPPEEVDEALTAYQEPPRRYGGF